MPETAVKTRDQIAADQIQFILRQDWFQPETLKKYIGALKNWQPNQLSVIIDGQIISYNRIVADLQQFLRSLPPDRRQNLSADGLAPDQLDLLDSIIDEVAGSAATAEAAQPTSANIPQDLKNLVAEFDKANQSAVSAQAKSQGWSPEKFREQIALQNQITIQMHQVRRYTLSQLEWAITNSTALENLAASLGVRPQDVKNLALQRAKTLVDKNITAFTFRQARALITDPVQLAAYYTAQLKQDLLSDDLLSLAAVDKDPKTKQKYLDTALKKTKEATAAETEKVKPAIEAAAENLAWHPSVQKAAQADAIAAVKQVETVSLGKPPEQQLKPAKSARLTQQLVRHLDNPSLQEKIIAGGFRVSSSQAKVIHGQLAPQINRLAAASITPNYLAMADPDSIFNDISLHPTSFPRPLVDAIRSGRISDPGKLGNAIIISRTLNIPLEAVVLSQWGADAQKLVGRWQRGPKFLGFIPMGHAGDPKDPAVAKLSNLAAAQKQLTDSLKTPPPLLPPQIPRQFLKTAAGNSRAIRFSEFFDQINIFRIPSAVSFNLRRLPPFKTIDSFVAPIVSNLRVKSPITNFIFSAYNTFTGGIPQIPSAVTSFVTTPFRAVGQAVSQRIINPVKTWAGTQIKSGLAKAGAWLAKKGVTQAAKKVGMALLGKGTAALLAQAVPVAGQIVGALMLLSALGDIGKFIWANRKEIGFGLAGMFLLGQMLLGKLIAFLTTAAWTLGLGTLGFIMAGPVGAVVLGGIGYLIGSGTLASVISTVGTWLGSAATGLSSFIGALTAPSLVAGLGSTVATAGLLGVGAAWAIQTFFIQPNINSALYVAPGGGGPIPPISKDTTCSSISGTLYCFPVAPLSNVDQPVNCTHHTYAATDIFSNSDNAIGPTGDAHLTIVAYIGGTVIWDSTPSSNPPGGYALEIQGDDGRYYYYAHNYSNIVKKGDRVTTGQPIAIMDSTGGSAYTCEHLHFGISTQPDFTVCLDGNDGLSGDCPNYQYFISPSADFQQTLGMSCQDKPQPCL